MTIIWRHEVGRELELTIFMSPDGLRFQEAHSVAYTGPRVHQADSDRSKPQPGNAGFACGNKTKCSQMISCEEARFYLTRCSVKSLDKDGNGVPCEALCK
jgi:hypothetical protein